MLLGWKCSLGENYRRNSDKVKQDLMGLSHLYQQIKTMSKADESSVGSVKEFEKSVLQPLLAALLGEEQSASVGENCYCIFDEFVGCTEDAVTDLNEVLSYSCFDCIDSHTLLGKDNKTIIDIIQKQLDNRLKKSYGGQAAINKMKMNLSHPMVYFARNGRGGVKVSNNAFSEDQTGDNAKTICFSR